MPLTEITTALSGIKTAMEIGKAIVAADYAVEKATLKLQVAELMGALADAKVAVVEAQEKIEEKEDEIEGLHEALVNSAKVVKGYCAHYEVDEKSGAPVGHPYCMHCWEEDHHLAHLVLGTRTSDPSKCSRWPNREALGI